MTPQEKGDELIEAYWNQIWHNLTPVNYNAKLKDGSNNSLLEQSVECSIIAVEEIIKELQGHSDLHGYWQDEKERQSVVQRILFHTNVLNYLKSKL